ncbi:MAG TPA: flagellar basal body-associated FliL family protein [Beijerinckiaceae bacterium]|jgi:flagellar FliL protein
MASAADTQQGGGGFMAVVLAFAVITVVAAGVGFGYRMFLAKPTTAAPAAAAKPAAGAPVASGEKLRRLPPLITNLADAPNTWLRLEIALLLDPAMKDLEADVLAREIGEDVMAYARTLSLFQLQGSSGLYHLREDLHERATLRSGGKVREILVQSLVVQ